MENNEDRIELKKDCLREKRERELKRKKKKKYNEEKDRYFSYYDDIKVSSHKIIDW